MFINLYQPFTGPYTHNAATACAHNNHLNAWHALCGPSHAVI